MEGKELKKGLSYYRRDGRVVKLLEQDGDGWNAKLESAPGGRTHYVFVRPDDLEAEAGPKGLREMFAF